MKKEIGCFLIILCCCGFYTPLKGQETIPATGGNATSIGGSVSYTVGQVTYNTFSGTNGTIAQGVQQPYEISVVTAIRNTEEINLECLVYPNPTSGLVKLVLKSPPGRACPAIVGKGIPKLKYQTKKQLCSILKNRIHNL